MLQTKNYIFAIVYLRIANIMKLISTLLFFFFIVLPSIEASTNKDIQQLLSKLDSLITQKEYIEKKKEERIAQLRLQKHNISSLEEEYWLNKKFYNEYYVYNADSASYYINRNLTIAEKMAWEERATEWKIKHAHLLTATGLLKEATDELQKIGTTKDLPSYLKIEYYGEMIYLYSHFRQYFGNHTDNKHTYHEQEMAYRDSICAIITPQHPLYLWFTGEKAKATGGNTSEIIRKLTAKLDTSQFNTYQDAMNAYILAHLYLEAGNQKSYLKYIIYSSMADVHTANRDIASLGELSKILFKMGDIDRAYAYGNYCLQMGQVFHNRIRTADILSLLDQVHKAYQERQLRQQNRLSHYLITVSILSAILLISIFYIYRQVKRLSESKQKLNATNILLNEHVKQLFETQQQLKEMNSQLQQLNTEQCDINNQLYESNYIKEEYIGYVFSICSTYISKLDEFRKTINRKLKTGQTENARILTESSIVKKELREFYHSFDTIFLHVYPNFVSDFNALLRPEEQVVPKEGELLNTDLRIYALVRLGINDSMKIAQFLHCSLQTVYNNRLKMRNKAAIPREEFVERVKSLGKYNIK